MYLNICNNSGVLSVFYLIKSLLNIISIVVPIILILLISIDLFLMVRVDEDKARKRFGFIKRRLFWASIIFFLPVIINLVLSLLGAQKFEKNNCWQDATAEVIRLRQAEESAIKKAEQAKRAKALEEYRLNKAYGIGVRSGIEAKNKEEADKLFEELQREEEKARREGYGSPVVQGNIGEDGVVRYFQCDYKAYNYSSYGTICSHGCGPTSAAVVLSTLLKPKTYTPVETTKGVCAKGGCYSTGSSWDGVNRYIRSQGVDYTAGALAKFNSEFLASVFNQGKMIIVLVGPGEFTTGGHYFVLYGMASNGEVKIVQVSNKKQTARTWPVSTIRASLRSYYIYTKM